MVEDVVIGKESTTRQQTAKGDVRKTEVEVEQVSPGYRSGQKPAQERRKSSAAYAGMERRSAVPG